MDKLTYTNNWEADIYVYQKKPIIRLEEVLINNKLYAVRTQVISIPYEDMGHTYYGTSNHYFVTTKCFDSVEIELDLSRVVNKCVVIPTKYKVG